MSRRQTLGGQLWAVNFGRQILGGQLWAVNFPRKTFIRKSSIGKFPGSVAADLFFPHGTSVLPAAAQPLRRRMSPSLQPWCKQLIISMLYVLATTACVAGC